MQQPLSANEQLDVLFSFAESLIHQTSHDDLLWYAAEQVVAKLGFLDCVIYRFDTDAGVLVQSAAIGEKLNERHEIINPLIIPLDKGVTGECARTRKPIILPDTGAHPNYVADNI
jgi:putative methionine-R-sulfoxide reductase with GAF domain